MPIIMTVTLQDYSFKDTALKTHTQTIYKIRELVKTSYLKRFFMLSDENSFKGKGVAHLQSTA